MTEGNWHKHKYSSLETIMTLFVIAFLVMMFVKFLFF
jgi:hypothetical protein